MNTDSKILIIVGGSISKLDPFREPAKKLGLDVTFATFSDLSFISNPGSSDFILKIGDTDIADFDVIYVRMVGRRVEDVTLLANYAVGKGVRIVDNLYQNALLLPSSISKAMEMKKLIESGVPFPRTFFGSLDKIKNKAPELFGFNFVIKSTSGKKARDVWSPKTQEELGQIVSELKPREKSGDRFFAQQMLRSTQRIRVLAINGKAVAAITRPTKYRKRFLNKDSSGEYPNGEKSAIYPIPPQLQTIAENAANAANLDIAGVDIMPELDSDRLYVIEVNAAPSWKLIAKDTKMIVEEEILNFLSQIAQDE